jgi:carbon-monoxide dehydrogenase large subunit
VHASATRVEDLRLITGRGRYASDWKLPDQLHAAFLRADRAHAEIVSIDTAAARAAPGVVGVFTGDDAIAAGYNKNLQMLTITGRDGLKPRLTPRPALAHGKVRFVGEPVVLVVAETAAAAQDATELIQIEYRDLDASIDPFATMNDGVPQLHEAAANNIVFDWEAGDGAATNAALAKAAHVVEVKLECTRVVPNPMEPRAIMIRYDAAADAYDVYSCLQGVNMLKKQLSAATDIPEDKFRVYAKDVGGSFGNRSAQYPEHTALMLAARKLGRPVRWVSTRSEGLASDFHGRANFCTARLALDAKGKMLAIDLDWVADMGAYLSPTGGASHTRNPATCIFGVYRIPAVHGRFRLVLTNTAPVAAYRGAGRPDVAYFIERVVDEAAVKLKMDRAELRRKNFIPQDAFPYPTPTGAKYELADFEGCLDQALKIADWKGFEARRAEAKKRGKLRGIGLSTVIEGTGAGAFHKDEILLEYRDGKFIAYSVAHSQGQSHETTFAGVIAETLGVPPDRVRLVEGSPDKTITGNHTGGSRSMVGAGSVCKIAAQKLIEKAVPLAAVALECEPSQVEFANGVFSARGMDKSVPLTKLAEDCTARDEKALDVVGEGSVGSTFPNGCHVAEVEVDPETGVTEIVAYNTVDDCGTVINHAVVEGQIHGAVVQGAGQVFGEKAFYDPGSGQLLTGTFQDYYMPRAGILKHIRVEDRPVPSRLNVLGAKGVGEAGCTASIPALNNAVIDALRPLGISHLDMPLTPLRVWEALQKAKKK